MTALIKIRKTRPSSKNQSKWMNQLNTISKCRFTTSLKRSAKSNSSSSRISLLTSYTKRMRLSSPSKYSTNSIFCLLRPETPQLNPCLSKASVILSVDVTSTSSRVIYTSRWTKSQKKSPFTHLLRSTTTSS